MATTIRTSAYEHSHGRKPKGEGWWMFNVGGQVMEFPMMTYSKAKAQALKWAKQADVSSIEVLP